MIAMLTMFVSVGFDVVIQCFSNIRKAVSYTITLLLHRVLIGGLRLPHLDYMYQYFCQCLHRFTVNIHEFHRNQILYLTFCLL